MTLMHRRTNRLLVAVGVAVALAACSASAGVDAPAGDAPVEISDARTPVPAGPNGAVYMTLTNPSSADARLVGGSSDVSEAIELHESTTGDGTMRMRQLQAIHVPAGGETVLEPGGLHVMLMDVAPDLEAGQLFALTLEFDDGSEQRVNAEVVPAHDGAGAAMPTEPA